MGRQYATFTASVLNLLAYGEYGQQSPWLHCDSSVDFKNIPILVW